MFGKKLISVLTGICLAAGNIAVLNVSAAEQETNGLFADKKIVQQIKTNMHAGDSASYGFVFGTYDVFFDTSHIVREYTINYERSLSAEKVSDIIEAGEHYFVPVVSESGGSLALAEFKKIPTVEEAEDILLQFSAPEQADTYNELYEKYTDHAGEWEMTGAASGEYIDQFNNFITSDSGMMDIILSYEHAYLVEDVYGYNIILISGDTEKFFSFSDYINGKNDESGQDNSAVYDGNIFLQRAKEQYESYLADPNGIGAASNIPADYIPVDSGDIEIQEEPEELQADDDKIETDNAEVEYPDIPAADDDGLINEPDNGVSAEDISDNAPAETESVPNPVTGNNDIEVIAFAVFASAICMICMFKKAE